MEVIENNDDSESIYMNMEDVEKNSNQSEIYDNIYLNTTTEISGSAGACEKTKVNNGNMAAVGLGFLCVLLLVVIIVICVKRNKETHQIKSRYDIMTAERDALQSRYDIMTAERDALQSRYDIMTMEKERLLNLNNILTSARNKLQSSYNALKSELDAKQKKLTKIDSCPNGWTRFLSSCYLVSSLTTTWDQSRQNCLMTGDDLVIINSKEEQEFVSALGKNVWIGLTDEYQEGRWEWVDNTPLESGYWMTNEPNNAGYPYRYENCAVLLQVGQVISNWNDDQCSRTYYGLCEKKIRCSTR